MSTFVLVHGGGHGGWCWNAVADRLRQLGHHVVAPTLSGLAERQDLLSPAITLDTHVNDVVARLVEGGLSDVILVGHSYGGMVITGVADRMPDQVRRLVYLDAAIPENGESLLDVSPGLAAFRDVREVDGVALGLWPNEAVMQGIYGLRSPELVAHAMQHLTAHPWKTVEAPLHFRNSDRLTAIPRTIVNCAETLARRPAALRHRWSNGDCVRTVEAAHDLMLTDPDLVVRMMLDIAAL